MKGLILILLWASSIFFFTLYARDSDAAVQAGKKPPVLQANAILPIQNLNSQRCIGVDRASTSSGAYIKQFRCDGSDNQEWLLNSLDGDHYTIQNKKSGMCMGVDHASTNPNADIRQFPCDSSLNQIWILLQIGTTCATGDDTNQWCIINEKSELCVGVNHSSTADGAQLKQFPCDGRLNQFWIIPLPPR